MQIDVNQLANSLNAKIDLPQGLNQSQIDYVVDWKAPTANDPTWYRVYKSGWVEQGGVRLRNTGDVSKGYVTITLPKAMSTSSYNINIQQANLWSTVGVQWNFYTIGYITETSFAFNYGSNDFDTMWTVSGMGAN